MTPKQQWIDELLSGNYKQAQGILREGNTFCCLGVLCDLYIKDHPDESNWKENDSFNSEIDKDSCSYLPTTSVYKWVEITATIANELSDMNDRGKTFEEIAYFLKTVIYNNNV